MEWEHKFHLLEAMFLLCMIYSQTIFVTIAYYSYYYYYNKMFVIASSRSYFLVKVAATAAPCIHYVMTRG